MSNSEHAATARGLPLEEGSAGVAMPGHTLAQRALYWLGAATFRVSTALAILSVAAVLPAQEFQTLEQVSARNPVDFSPALEGRPVAVQAQVSGPAVWAVGMNYLPVRDRTDHGLLLRGERSQFAGLTPGDWVEVRGTVQSRAGLPLLAPGSINSLAHENAPPLKELPVTDLCGLRYVGLPVRTTALVRSVGERNLGGQVLRVEDHGCALTVFLPRTPGSTGTELARVRPG